jgi:hypothetical protein
MPQSGRHSDFRDRRADCRQRELYSCAQARVAKLNFCMLCAEIYIVDAIAGGVAGKIIPDDSEVR